MPCETILNMNNHRTVGGYKEVVVIGNGPSEEAHQFVAVSKPADDNDDSEDDIPLAARKATAPARPPKKGALDDAEELPTAPRPKSALKPVAQENNDSTDSDDDLPLAQRRPQSGASGKPRS